LEAFDVLFADPPYGKGLGEKAMAAAAEGGWLQPGAIAVLEERADVVVSVHPSYVFLESRIFGDTRVHFFRYQPQ
ncbi:RsmD family RNA methyltransferase, partial [Rhizobium ruizarguesonis]